jgi:hypothetical protein
MRELHPAQCSADVGETGLALGVKLSGRRWDLIMDAMWVGLRSDGYPAALHYRLVHHCSDCSMSACGTEYIYVVRLRFIGPIGETARSAAGSLEGHSI